MVKKLVESAKICKELQEKSAYNFDLIIMV